MVTPALSKANPSPSMAHDLAGRCLKAPDNSSNWFRILNTPPIILNPVRRLFFGCATKFAGDDDGLCVVIVLKDFESVDKVCACNHVTANCNA